MVKDVVTIQRRRLAACDQRTVVGPACSSATFHDIALSSADLRLDDS